MNSQIRPAFVTLLFFTILTGLLYPLAVTAVAQAFFPFQANGSFIIQNKVVVGSELIGQPFDAPGYFWGRPSATDYNASASAGSNLGPTNPALIEVVKARIAALQAADPANKDPIPVDLVTASASGLDPDISVAAAIYQVPRVARARGVEQAKILDLVKQNVEPRQLGFLGEPRINVLRLNLALDGIQ